MRALITTLLFLCSLGLTFAVCAAEPQVTARLLTSNPSPYIGEEIDLLLEVTYNGHPGGRTRFHWPKLDNFVAADLTAVHSQRGRDGQPFFLDSRTAGRLLNVPHTQAWRWLRSLCDEGILELVSTGSRRDRKANEYRYLPVD